jgi:hypothetical protein
LPPPRLKNPQLTYSISENFRRRERCADVIAQMKASAVSLMWLHRDLDRGVRKQGDALHRVEQLVPQAPRRDSQLHVGANALPALPAGSTVYNAFVVLNEFLSSTRLFLNGAWIGTLDTPDTLECMTTNIVPVPAGSCPCCGRRAATRSFEQPTLFRHGGHGGTAQKTAACGREVVRNIGHGEPPGWF